MAEPVVNRVELALLEEMQFEAQDEAGATAILDAAPPLGESAGFTPMELLLAGVGGCTAMDVISILRKMRQDVTGYRLEVSGVRANEHPKVYTEITIHHIFTGNGLSEDAVGKAIELSEEKYCSAFAMLRKAAKISTAFQIRSPQPATA